MEKEKKKKFNWWIPVAMASLVSTALVIRKNGQLNGQIKNLQLENEGLLREIKNLTYHLGKKSSTKI